MRAFESAARAYELLADGAAIAVMDGVVIETVRGGAGRMTFSSADKLDVGCRVSFLCDGRGVFRGRVFSSTEIGGAYEYEAYDSTRYLEGRDAYSLVNVTADAVVRAAASMFGLECGAICDTGYVIGSVADEASARAVIENALEMTADAGFGRYLLYDDFGRLSLVPLSEAKADLTVSAGMSLKFEMTKEIGGDHFNYATVVRYVDDVRRIYTAEDADDIEKYGRLSYLRRLRTSEYGQLAADAELSSHLGDAVTVKCTLPFSNGSLRGGAPVDVDTGGGKILTASCVRCRTTYSVGEMTTELTLSTV